MTTLSVDGLSTGLNTTEIISQLIAADSAPVVQMQAKKATLDSQAAAWADITSKVTTLGTAVGDLVSVSKLTLNAATSSNPTALSATATSAAVPGTYSLRTASLATNHQVASAGVVSTASDVGMGTATLGSGLPALGLRGAVAGAGLTTGDHAVEVTQSSSAATITGAPVTMPVTITAANQAIEITVNGEARSVNVATGTYTSTDALATAVQNAVSRLSDVHVSAIATGLELTTVREGSAAGLQITGGSALATLGLSAGSAAGTDGVISLDGIAVTLTSITPGQQLTLTGPSGSLDVTFAGGVRVGTGTVHVLRSATSQSLAQLGASIVAADSSLAAQYVDTGVGTTPVRMVVSSTKTGLDAAFTLDLSGFAPGTDGTTTVSSGRDASLVVGGLHVVRSTNTVADLVPGVTLNLAAATDAAVDVTVAHDTAAIVGKVKSFVDAVNGVLAKIRDATKVDDKGKGSVLTGDSRARSITAAIQSAMSVVLGTGTVRTLSQLGISVQRDGTYAFDQAKLEKALADDFEGTARLIARSATASDSRVEFVTATNDTVAATVPFAVSITQAAAQGAFTGGVFTTLAASDTIGLTVGTRSLTYTAAAGSSPAGVAAGLNGAFADQKLPLLASVTGGAVTITTVGYGSSAAFTVTSTGGTGLNGTAAGVDVAGTIDGVAATGAGQSLSGTTEGAKGLVLRITATAADVASAGGNLALGDVTYSAGAAGNLSRVLSFMTKPGGLLVAAKDSATSQSKELQKSIEDFQVRLDAKRVRYVRQFSQLETIIGQLKNQSAWLGSQVSALIAGQK